MKLFLYLYHGKGLLDTRGGALYQNYYQQKITQVKKLRKI
jgi:hypothetical protein